MRRGFKTTEFWVAILWWSLTACAVASVFFLRCPANLFMACVSGALAYFSCALCNNYSENRYLLKSERRQQEAAAGEPRQAFGFGRYVAVESESENEDEE